MTNKEAFDKASKRLRGVAAREAAHSETADERQLELERQREKQLRQRQALEINDNVVQGLTVAKYAMDAGDMARAKEVVEHTLMSARHIVTDLLNEDDADDLKLGPGDLIRLEPATVVLAPPE